ncbi:MAG: hypothetical protein EBU27_05985 [Opitutae bacterium]|nr:hypothetical protein [Opitutae bacterium]
MAHKKGQGTSKNGRDSNSNKCSQRISYFPHFQAIGFPE